MLAALPMLMVAAIAGYVGVYHLYVARRVPSRRGLDRAFGLQCLASANYAVASAAGYMAPSVESAAKVHRYLDTWGLLMAVSLPVFIQRYTGKGTPRRSAVVGGIVLASIVLVWLMPTEWVAGFPEARESVLFGTPFRYFDPRPGPGVVIVQVTALLAFTESLRMVALQVRARDPRARPLAGAMLFATVTVFFDLYSDHLGTSGVYLLPYSIVALMIVMAYTLAGDVLQAALAEEALRRRDERFQLAVAGTSDGLFDWDLVSHEFYYSERFAEILELPLERLAHAGRNPFGLVALRDREGLERAIDAAVESGTPLDVEVEIVTKPEPRWVRIRARSVHSGGIPTRFAGAISDATTRRRTEMRLRESQKLESVGRLAGGVAHDFNNMLAGVVAFADLIRRERSLTARARDAADHIIEAGLRASELTTRLLAFSRQTSGVSTEVDGHRAIGEALSLLERTIDRRVIVERHLEAKHHVVRGDAAQVQSAVLNLGLNARDAMRDGGTIRVVTRNESLSEKRRSELGIASSAERFLVIGVTDTGTGIPPEHMSHIFEPFYTTKPVGEGTGLGLAAVAATVDEMGGAVALETAVGRGTTVELYLPVADATSLSERPIEVGSTPRYEGVAIVIDDEATVREALRASLSTLGFSVAVAEDGPAGVAKLRERRAEVALVVMDVVLPKWSADETYRELRAVDGQVPIIVVSGYSGETQVNALLAKGATAFVAKPFRLEALFRTVDAALAGEPRARSRARLDAMS